MSEMTRFVGGGRWILLAPLLVGLLGLDVLIASRAIIIHRQRAEYDAEDARLNELLHFKPYETRSRPDIFTVF
jgi:hypothetical protein